MTLTVSDQCKQAVIATIQDLGLEGVEDDEIRGRDAPADWNSFQHRGISVIGLAEQELPGTNASEDYGYPFLVVWCKGTGKGPEEETTQQAEWRHAVRTAFNQKRLPAVTEVWICLVNNGELLNKREWADNRALSTLVVTCWARQRRPS